ncbi:hypothetical protein ACFLUT_03840 [Chloroflexota bacterium]
MLVLAGIDTLEVGYALTGHLGEDDLALLEEAKAKAQARQFDSAGYAVTFHGRQFQVMPRGTSGKEWRMQNDDVSIALAREWREGTVYPELHVRYWSEYLWREAWEAAEGKFRAWLAEWATVVADKVSRVDLTVDHACPCPDVDIRGREITGTVVKRDDYASGSHARGHRLTGYSFGGGSLLGRIYDKKREAKQKGKEWFYPMWKENGWDGEAPVTRTEFEFKRGMLKQWQVTGVSDLRPCMGDLWQFATQTWLVLRTAVDTDSNYRRWPVSEFWKAVQAAGENFGTVTGVERMKQLKPEVHRLLRSVRGNLASAIAAAGSSELGEEHGWRMAKWWLKKELQSEEFRALVEERSAKFATM